MQSPVKTPLAGTPDIGAYSSLWDARTRKYRSVLLQVSLFILVMELAERLSYYGFSQGLMNFMKKKLGWERVTASALKSTWTSICYLSPVFGAYLADERWGRFRTILTFGIWYLIGDVLVVIASHPSVYAHKSLVNPIYVIGLFLGIGVGTGAIKSSVITFGADQFNIHDENEVKQKDTYFSYFYMCINVGAAFSYGYLSVLSVDGAGFISREYGYFATYLLCAIFMALALGSLVFGYRRYVFVKPTDKAVSTLARLMVAAPRYHFKGAVWLFGTLIMISSIFINIASAATSNHENLSQGLAYLSAFTVLVGILSWVWCGIDPSFLDAAKDMFDPKKIEDYKALVRVLPFAAFLIVWQCVYDQVDANFQSITQQCDLRWHTGDPNSSQVPGALLMVFDPIVIVIFIPILDIFIYPWYKKTFGKNPSRFGKVATGLVLAVVTVFWAACFEMIRRHSGPLQHNGEPILDNGSGLPMNKIHWTAAIPNYILVALAECVINVTAFETFYSYVPMSLKSTAQSVNFLTFCMGGSLTSAFTLMFRKYVKDDDLNLGHLEYMYFAMGLVGLVNLAGFVTVMRKMNFGMHDSPVYGELETEELEKTAA